MPLTPLTPDLTAALARRLPDGAVGEVPEAYRAEPRGRYTGTAGALVRPRSTGEVVEVVRFAGEEGVGLVPYGGGTGLVGGQTPEGPACLLVSLERMAAIREVDADGSLAIAEAGVVLADLQKAAADAGRLFPLSLASEGSARLGGLLGTNAGGTAVLRYGNMRDLCLGLEAVLPDGSVLRGLGRLRKDNTGYDLRHLLIGSEGTLGIVTAVSLRLFPQPAEVATAMLATESPAAALEVLALVRDRLGEALSGFEIMHARGFEFLAEVLPGTPLPFEDLPRWALLVEAGAGPGAGVGGRLETALAEALERGLISDALIAQNRAQAAAFWEVRERIPEANRLIGAVASHDISVPVARVPAFIDQATAALEAIEPALRINCFGHLGDGNLHFNVFPAKGGRREDHAGKRAEVVGCVHDLVARHEGSISAEHGIGRLKTGDLVRYGDPAKIAAMRAIKAALDPKGIMNPGVLFET